MTSIIYWTFCNIFVYAGKYITFRNTTTLYSPFRAVKYQFEIKNAKVLVNAKIVFALLSE